MMPVKTVEKWVLKASESSDSVYKVQGLKFLSNLSFTQNAYRKWKKSFMHFATAADMYCCRALHEPKMCPVEFCGKRCLHSVVLTIIYCTYL